MIVSFIVDSEFHNVLWSEMFQRLRRAGLMCREGRIA